MSRSPVAAIMNLTNENQHWISQHLLKRFKSDGAPLQCYQIKTGEWVEKGLSRICASPGYNQLILSGEVDNSLEAAFSKIESFLPQTLRALERAANQKETALPQVLYENMCWYCAFLKGTAPYSKVGSVVTFLIELNRELEQGTHFLLNDLKVPEGTIRDLQLHHEAGHRVIVESENLLQLLYRFQFNRNTKFRYVEFLNVRWTVRHSPTQLPMSDVGLVPLLIENLGLNHYMLPLGPDILLEGMLFHDASKNSATSTVQGVELNSDEAESRFDCICASALTELICGQKISGISEARSRAKESGTRFHQISDIEVIKTSGLEDVGSGDFQFRIVSADEYRSFVHSFMRPPE